MAYIFKKQVKFLFSFVSFPIQYIKNLLISIPNVPCKDKKDRTPFGVHTEGALASTNFAREFPRKRGTSFGRNCEPVFACKHAKARSMEWWQRPKRQDTVWCPVFFGGATRNRTGDRGVADLCLTAWPWRHFVLNKWIIAQIFPIVKGFC